MWKYRKRKLQNDLNIMTSKKMEKNTKNNIRKDRNSRL